MPVTSPAWPRGRSEAEIAALGDPVRLARELRAEAGACGRWETARTPSNFYAAFGGPALIAVDFMFLLPLLGALAIATLLGLKNRPVHRRHRADRWCRCST